MWDAESDGVGFMNMTCECIVNYCDNVGVCYVAVYNNCEVCGMLTVTV